MENHDDLMRELETLRAYKEAHEGRALNRAFNRLEQLLICSSFDPLISVRAFRVIAECLMTLRDEVECAQRRTE